MMIAIPEISPENLEKALKHLPEPLYAEVALYGEFDYSSISKQAETAAKGLKLSLGRGVIFRLESPSKENISNVYRTSREIWNLRKTSGSDLQRRVDLHKVCWYSNDKVKIELTPYEISASYSGKEPSYLSHLRNELRGTHVRLKFEINHSLA